jgi:hypothetical protein
MRQDLGVPTISGPDLDHVISGLIPKELALPRDGDIFAGLLRRNAAERRYQTRFKPLRELGREDERSYKSCRNSISSWLISLGRSC